MTTEAIYSLVDSFSRPESRKAIYSLVDSFSQPEQYLAAVMLVSWSRAALKVKRKRSYSNDRLCQFVSLLQSLKTDACIRK